jgi:hypothetical protein
MTRRVLLVASNDTHVALYAPVVERLLAAGARYLVISLDPAYDQGATAAARARRLRARELDVLRYGKRPFYLRPFWMIWRDVLRARAPLRSLLGDEGATTVVLANDRGLIEKLILHEARRRGIRTLLVQDGRLAPRPRPSTRLRTVRHHLKMVASAGLRSAGLPFLAASEYGSGGADVLCASGPAGARILESRRRPNSSVRVCGQPRYDELPEPMEMPLWDVMIFTTPFEAAGLGVEFQRRQEALVGGLLRWSELRAIRIAVKPHPREDAERYVAQVGREAVIAEEPRTALADVRLAIAGMSTVVEEAGLIGCPVLVFGSMVHGRHFESSLPPSDVYPRGDQAAELTELIERYLAPDDRVRLLHRQMEYVRREVYHDPDHPAAEAIARLVLG